MIIPIDINPEKSLYFLGSYIINILNDETMGLIDIELLYNKLNESIINKISFNYYLYVLDWLFLLNLIKLDNNKIEKCF